MDKLQEIARSSYADMLHDDERNHAYNVAIRTVVNYLITSTDTNPNKDRHFSCCDIGSGSGLLSMMVARSFCELGYKKFHVDAYECFEPMSAAAKAIIKLNGFSDYINVHTEQVGTGNAGRNPQYDLLVAELLDTELIGEGCLEIYRFAVENLCSKNCIFIPKKARIYIEPISSNGLFKRQVIQVDAGPEAKACCGLAELDDMQTSFLNGSFGFERITDCQVAFEIKFNDLSSLKLNDSKRLHFVTKRSIKEEIVIHMWWDAVMYDEELFAQYGPNEYEKLFSFSELSNAPTWCRSDYQRKRDKFIEKIYNRNIWREHWIQAIYYVKSHQCIEVLLDNKQEESVEFDVFANHDNYSLWFDLFQTGKRLPCTCACGIHRRLNRYELSFLNGSHVLRDLIYAYDDSSNLRSKLELDETIGKWRLDFWHDDDGINLPPRFSLHDYGLNQDFCWNVILNRCLNGCDTKPISSFEIVFNQVTFHTLNRIRTRVGHCQGFNLSPMDELIEHCAQLVDSSIEFHHLWEYSCDILGPEMVLFNSEKLSHHKGDEVIFRERVQVQLPEKKSLELLRSEWALVFSCNFRLINGTTIKSGRVTTKNWNHYLKQAVHFLHDHPALLAETKPKHIVIDIELNRNGLSIKR